MCDDYRMHNIIHIIFCMFLLLLDAWSSQYNLPVLLVDTTMVRWSYPNPQVVFDVTPFIAISFVD